MVNRHNELELPLKVAGTAHAGCAPLNSMATGTGRCKPADSGGWSQKKGGTMRFAAIVALWFTAALAQAQSATPVATAGPPPTGIVVNSGSFFSPIVQDLGRALSFYGEGLGFDVSGQPGEGNPALRDMFGLPDAKISWLWAARPALPAASR